MSNTTASPIPVTVNWRALSVADAQHAWDDLTEWVDWLAGHYDLPVSVIPTCWFGHGALVEELSALHTAWQAAYTVATRSPTAGVEWHTQFGHARRRLADWITTVAGECSHGRAHAPSRPALAWDSDLLRATIAADLASRA